MSTTTNSDDTARPETILILDDNGDFLESAKSMLKSGGFSNVYLAIDYRTAVVLADAVRPRVALVDLNLGVAARSGLHFVKHLVQGGFETIPVVISADKSQKQFFRAARSGAADFLVKGPHVDLAQEVARLLDGKRGLVAAKTLPDIVSDLGYLRSFGLTRKEIEVLSEFSRGFPSLSLLADRVEQAPGQLRKIFSRIYEKLGVADLHQLIRVLTICELFDLESAG